MFFFNRRNAITMAVLALAALVAAWGCSSTTSQPASHAKPHPTYTRVYHKPTQAQYRLAEQRMAYASYTSAYKPLYRFAKNGDVVPIINQIVRDCTALLDAANYGDPFTTLSNKYVVRAGKWLLKSTRSVLQLGCTRSASVMIPQNAGQLRFDILSASVAIGVIRNVWLYNGPGN